VELDRFDGFVGQCFPQALDIPLSIYRTVADGKKERKALRPLKPSGERSQ